MRRQTQVSLTVAGLLMAFSAADVWAGVGVAPVLIVGALLALLLALWYERRNILTLETLAPYGEGASLRVRNIGHDTVKAVSVRVVRVVLELPDRVVERPDLVPVNLSWSDGVGASDIAPEAHPQVVVLTRTDDGLPRLGDRVLPREAVAYVLTVRVTGDGNRPFERRFRGWRDFHHPSSPWGWEKAGRPQRQAINPYMEQLAKKHGFDL